MAITMKQLTHEVLELPVQERAKLAHILIASIHEKVEGDIPSICDAGLEKRVQDIKEGKVIGILVEEVAAKLKEKYH